MTKNKQLAVDAMQKATVDILVLQGQVDYLRAQNVVAVEQLVSTTTALAEALVENTALRVENANLKDDLAELDPESEESLPESTEEEAAQREAEEDAEMFAGFFNSVFGDGTFADLRFVR